MNTYTVDELAVIIKQHGKWLRGGSVLSRANLSGADLSGAVLSRANLSGADLSDANLSGANLSRANLSGANLSDANLSGANLSDAVLSRANLSRANLSDANLSRANLSRAVLSGAVGILSQQGYMGEWFKHDRRGFIVYKTFGTHFPAPSSWLIEPGSIITEVCNPDRCTDCGSGVNVATLEWVRYSCVTGDIWQCRIAWRDAPGIIVPFGTEGKIRAERVELIGVVPRQDKNTTTEGER